ncbi:putative yheA protein [Escherichia coli 3-073-06_S4_C1]|nr:putative yheA protein [Escherichia coli P0299438.4]KDU34679.1 putative yheA protein [Escherichia coli 3-073-06_S4_C1]
MVNYAVEVLLMSNPSVMTMKREKLRSKHIVMSGAMNERD